MANLVALKDYIIQGLGVVGVKIRLTDNGDGTYSEGTAGGGGGSIPISTMTDRSGSIAAGGTAQLLAAANAARTGFELQNDSNGDLWISELATAVIGAPSIRIPPGALYETPLGGHGTGAISIIGATTGQSFSARERT